MSTASAPPPLPDWAAQALADSQSAPEAPSVLSQRGSVAWPLFVEAAVVSRFLPMDLVPEPTERPERKDAEKSVLSFSQTVHTAAGPRWSLTREARIEIVSAILHTPEIASAMERTSSTFTDPVSAGLRDCLSGRTFDPSALGMERLEGLRAAVALLNGLSALTLPPLDSLDRELELRRLLSQFERMVGRHEDDGTQSNRDLFCGREMELEKMRAYVGVVAAKSIVLGIRRALSRVRLTPRGAMAVYGVGGVGKTTLVAKFMLEHAEAAASRFPFAYLDFDRTSISARDKPGLLLEMCTQTAAQFPGLAKPIDALAGKIRQLASQLELSRQPASFSQVAPFAREFRQDVDTFLDGEESMLESARPFLLVFDTFEVVQYVQNDVSELEEFVRSFSTDAESGLWPRLRLIISGRKRVATFNRPVTPEDTVEIGALDRDSSADLLIGLIRYSPRPASTQDGESNELRRQDALALIDKVAAVSGGDATGIEPLRIRLLAEIFEKKPNGSGAVAKQLIKEFSEGLDGDGKAALIDGILVRRVLEHVRDPRVKALADPGLVVRHITPDVIKQVMTRATSDPASPAISAELVDSESPGNWVVDDAEAADIYAAFAHEVGLVESEGNGLRHRPDVREQVLPLIRARRPKAFNLLHHLAFDYFFGRANADPSDLQSTIESIYHGLWVGESLTRLNEYWRRLGTADPRINPAEFDKNSDALLFLKAKGGAELTISDLDRLPEAVQLDWLSARVSDLQAERRVSSSVDSIRAASGERFERLTDLPEIAAVVARLLYRSGFWSDAADLIARQLEHLGLQELFIDQDGTPSLDERPRSPQSAYLSLARTWATIAGKAGGPPNALARLGMIAAQKDPIAAADIAAHTFIGNLRAGGSPEQNRWLRGIAVDAAMRVPETEWQRAPRVLRLAALIAGDSRPELLRLWAGYRQQLPRGLEPAQALDAYSRLFRSEPDLKLSVLEKRSAGTLDALDGIWQRRKQEVIEASLKDPSIFSTLRLLAAYDHTDWVRAIGNALSQVLLTSVSQEISAVLDKAGFKPPKSQDRFDGVGIVDAAVDGGRLLLFARTIVGWEGRRPDIAKPAGSLYPQGIFDICEAFLCWHATILDEFLGSMDAAPPDPQPIVQRDDDQKWRWGGSPHRDGRELTVKLLKVAADVFTFDATVSSTDDTPLQSPVVFHLHHTFPKSRITITKVKEHRQAILREVRSSGIFAVGVQVRNAAGRWIGLEFDLGSLEDLPRRFLSR